MLEETRTMRSGFKSVAPKAHKQRNCRNKKTRRATRYHVKGEYSVQITRCDEQPVFFLAAGCMQYAPVQMFVIVYDRTYRKEGVKLGVNFTNKLC